MDTTIFQIIGSVVNGGALLAIYLYIQRREDRIRTEMDNMQRASEARIEEAEEEAKEIRSNYNKKFTEVHDAMHKTEMRIMESIHALETNLRESHHTLADSVTKALARLEILITRRDAA